MKRLLHRFLGAKDGLAAVEFSFIAPVLITMFFGTVELSNALNARQNVTSIASTAADLVAQQSSVNNADMTNIMAALNSIMYPYPTDVAKIVITSVVDNGAGGGRVAWSNAQNGTPRAVNSTVTDLPAGLIVSGSGGSVILAEITYTYSSPSIQMIGPSVTMQSKFYAKPRRSLAVARVNS